MRKERSKTKSLNENHLHFLGSSQGGVSDQIFAFKLLAVGQRTWQRQSHNYILIKNNKVGRQFYCLIVQKCYPLLHHTMSTGEREEQENTEEERDRNIKNLLLATSSIFMSYNLWGLMGEDSVCILELLQPILCVSQPALSNQYWMLAGPGTGEFQVNFPISRVCLTLLLALSLHIFYVI